MIESSFPAGLGRTERARVFRSSPMVLPVSELGLYRFGFSVVERALNAKSPGDVRASALVRRRNCGILVLEWGHCLVARVMTLQYLRREGIEIRCYGS